MSMYVIVWEKMDGKEPVYTGYGLMEEIDIDNLRENVEKYSPYDYATVDTYFHKVDYEWLKHKYANNWKEGKL